MPAEGPTVTQMMFLNDKEYSHAEKGKQKASRMHFPYSNGTLLSRVNPTIMHTTRDAM